MATTGRPTDASPLPTGADLGPVRIGVITAQWNLEITGALRSGAHATLMEAGIPEENILHMDVPGAFELPLASKWLLEQGGCDAVIALGSVVRGETPHFDFVCQAATDGILRVGLDTGKPTVFGVLTDDTWDQARDRSGGRHGNKGVDCAEACLRMLALKKRLG
jgi:6,7-dimethyl-8-ribityllumazine synthase